MSNVAVPTLPQVRTSDGPAPQPRASGANAGHQRVNKVAVLGAGTMGARIAAHLANAGLPCGLLDMVPPDWKPGTPASERNRFARNGIEAAKKSRPAAFFSASLADRISIGNFDDDLRRCAEADWII